MKVLKEVHVKMKIIKDGKELNPFLKYKDMKKRKSWSNKKWLDFAYDDLKAKIGDFTLEESDVDKIYTE